MNEIKLVVDQLDLPKCLWASRGSDHVIKSTNAMTYTPQHCKGAVEQGSQHAPMSVIL
jgi:hypothetical protein